MSTNIGANSVLFGGFDLETAFKTISCAGYDGIELSAIAGMSEHLVIEQWSECVPKIRQFARTYDLRLLAIEQPSQDVDVMTNAFQAAAELEIPVVNCGPGGVSRDVTSLARSIESIGRLTEIAEQYGVTLCVKAHVGAAIFDTATTLQLMNAIPSPHLGIDMDPSHIHRAGENPVEAMRKVIHRVKHVHIRDCKGTQTGPGTPELQAAGRGDIDLLGYLRVLHSGGYSGPIDLEIIGAKEYSLVQCATIAAESRGYINACMKALDAEG